MTHSERLREIARECAFFGNDQQSAEYLRRLADALEKPAAWCTPIHWGKFQSETVEKLTRQKQHQFGFIQPLFTLPES